MESARRLKEEQYDGFNELPLLLSFANGGFNDESWAKEALEVGLKNCTDEYASVS
jgi:hypothetical protein